MKKILFTLILLLSITMYAQDTVQEINPESISQAERIIDKYGGQAVDKFNEAIDMATPLAEQGFKVAVRLQIAKGIVNLLPILLSLFSISFFFKRMKYIDKLESENKLTDGKEIIYLGTLFVSGIIGLLSIVTAFYTTGKGIQFLIAPEWYAIKEISELF